MGVDLSPQASGVGGVGQEGQESHLLKVQRLREFLQHLGEKVPLLPLF